MKALRVEDVAVTFTDSHRTHRALDGVSLSIDPGQTLAIVGPSGAGKSTLLRVIAGLLRPERGDVTLGGVSLAAHPTQERRIAMVFQDDALFPAMSVRENLRFAMRNGAHAAGIAQTARALGVSAHLDRRPRDLSGGERQRVALARALLSDPLALLLDEPLAHLDPGLRAAVRASLRDLRERFEGPVLYVTHDHAEAMVIGDMLGVLIDGRLEDCGPPERVYDSPANLRVAAFLGLPPMNLVTEGARVLGIRPEHVAVVVDAPLRGPLERREAVGADAYLRVRTPLGLVLARVPATQPFALGGEIALAFPPERVRYFDAESGAAIS